MEASTLPFSKELLALMSILKKLWIVVPLISDAATPLGASLVTTRLQQVLVYSLELHLLSSQKFFFEMV